MEDSEIGTQLDHQRTERIQNRLSQLVAARVQHSDERVYDAGCVVREVDAPRQALDCVYCLLTQCCSCVLPLVRLDDERDDELEVLFDVRAKREERVEDLHLRLARLVVQLPFEHL